ncbi:MAG: META domain-containing protein, partial [Prevotella sp.]|nr:META domain-containing protein [Prevotella sp.]
MKKISIIAAAIALCSCSATKTTDAAVDLNGEWDIVTVDGTAVDTTKTESRPILGFDTAKNTIYGCASCNSINGKAKVDAAKQTIKLSQVGTTMMLCANMEYEQKILKALESVKG